MSKPKRRRPELDRVYQKYLRDEDSATFIIAVSRRYTVATLERLALGGGRVTRRAATMSLGFLAGIEANGVLGGALHDEDRAVRLLAESGIRQLWFRAGSEDQRRMLDVIAHLNDSGRHDEACERCDQLIDDAPALAEAWNQRAVAHFYLGQFSEAADDCFQTLELNPYHFGAAVGMAHCYLELGDRLAALENFRRALRLNPNLEGVRAQVARLQRALKEE